MSEELISRNAAIEAVYERIRQIGYENNPLVLSIRQVILDLPSEQSERKTDGDTISRQEAIEAFGLSEKTRKYSGDHSGYNTMMLYEIQDILEGLPQMKKLPQSVDIAMHGKFIAEKKIEAIPAAEPQWIPVTERLPNEDEMVYNGIGIKEERTVSDRVLAIDSKGFIRCGYFMKSCSDHKYYGKGKRNKYSDYGRACWEFGEHVYSDTKKWIASVNAEIVAWMPLPTPMKGEDDG